MAEEKWSVEWQLKHQESYWLLIAGTSKSASFIKTADKIRKGGGSYLNGVTKDIANVESSHKTIQNVVRDMQYLKKSTVLNRIGRCVKEANKARKICRLWIYYTGHGQTNTGNWCFADGVVTLREVITTVRALSDVRLLIVCDCCYSGNWCENLAEYKGKYNEIVIKAATWPGKLAVDTKNGGKYTLKWLGIESEEIECCEAELNEKGEYSMKKEPEDIMENCKQQ
eukprot:259027_1